MKKEFKQVCDEVNDALSRIDDLDCLFIKIAGKEKNKGNHISLEEMAGNCKSIMVNLDKFKFEVLNTFMCEEKKCYDKAKTLGVKE